MNGILLHKTSLNEYKKSLRMISFDKKFSLFIMRHILFLIVYGFTFVAILQLIILPVYYNQRCSDATFRQNHSSNCNWLSESIEPEKEILKHEDTDGISLIGQQCNDIHLAFVCGGINSTRNFYVLLKSILFYRRDTLHLHILVDTVSRTILEELLSSWEVSDLKLYFYDMMNYEHEISWITSRHYSHRYGLMKLVFISILAELKKTQKVILMDTDMLVLGNIANVWKEFEKFDPVNNNIKPILGMVENQSDWYLSRFNKNSNIWPALGRGYNSGLIMVDLNESINQNWKEIWRSVAEKELTSSLTTPLADQDIFNAVIRTYNSIIYELPCNFNIQLNDHANINERCSQRGEFQIVHWNSPNKFSTKNQEANSYKDWYTTFVNWDGNLLKHSVCDPKSRPIEQKADISDRLETSCKELKPWPDDKLRIRLYFLDFEMEPVDNDITFVVHLSLDRLQVLDQLASHWQGPISAAIYLSEAETNLLQASIENSNNLIRRKNIGFHLVFREHGFNYPINRLRNIALNNSMTPFVFLSDIDFLPSLNSYEYLRKTITDLASRENVSDPLTKLAFVIPAFENLQYKFDFPTSKAELLLQLNLGSVSMFREQLWPKGHIPTDYARWKVSTRPYEVDWKPEYEPFIVTSKNVPRFDERFIGFGWNKVEHIMQLAATGYKFLVLPEAFVIHKFHSASYDIIQHRSSFKYRSCIRQLRRQFLNELREKFPDFFSFQND